MAFRVTSFFLSVPFGLEFRELQYLLCGCPTRITFIQTAEGLFFLKDKNEPEESHNVIPQQSISSSQEMSRAQSAV